MATPNNAGMTVPGEKPGIIDGCLTIQIRVSSPIFTDTIKEIQPGQGQLRPPSDSSSSGLSNSLSTSTLTYESNVHIVDAIGSGVGNRAGVNAMSSPLQIDNNLAIIRGKETQSDQTGTVH